MVSAASKSTRTSNVSQPVEVRDVVCYYRIERYDWGYRVWHLGSAEELSPSVVRISDCRSRYFGEEFQWENKKTREGLNDANNVQQFLRSSAVSKKG